ncbi:MAG: M13 family metallopeptidase N-terminal domain-containing protein [Acidobacteriota bacterium]
MTSIGLGMLLVATVLPAQPRPPEHSVFMGDIDTSVDPCTNFFDYSNGAWRKANPIPASMQRWSRRWAAGEENKNQLRELLDDEVKRNDWPRGSVDQQISDFYSACMDEEQVNKLGAKPIERLLKEIRSIENRAGLQAMIARLADLQISAPFGVGPSPDNHNPSAVIANVFASGLGLPDRDYYVKPEKRFVDAREKYRTHIARMFMLAGYGEESARKASDSVFALEKRLAAGQLDNVALRNPEATDHKLAVEALQKLTPHFDWNKYLDRSGIAPADLNVSEPKYMQAVDKELLSTPLSTWKTYLTWNVINTAAPYLSTPIATADFEFYGRYLNGAKEIKPRWKRCVEAEDKLLGEALGRRYVERYFPQEAKARMQDLVKNLLSAMADSIRALDWMSPETKTKALEKLTTFNPKVGYPDKWKDYSAVPISADSHWQNVTAGLKFGTTNARTQIGKPVDRGL